MRLLDMHKCVINVIICKYVFSLAITCQQPIELP
jgi:hypothetical protein